MIRSLYTAGSGLLTGQRQVDTISNNIANVNTVGYKESRVNFSDILYANLQTDKNSGSPNRLSNPGIQVGQGVRPSSVTKVMKQGSLLNTENPFDLAIAGEGFFGVSKDGQLHLTRHGNFQVDTMGTLVNSDGYSVEGVYSESLLNYSDIKISPEGIISGTNDLGEIEQIGLINVFNVENPQGLLLEGENLYSLTENSGGAEVIQSDIRQYALEGSNVNIANQFSNLIVSQRGLEASAKLVHTTDEMMSQANNIRR